VNLDSLRNIGRDDFYLSVPSATIRFLEQDSETKLLARPQLRGAEGETLRLDLGEEVPIPTTVFTPVAAGGASSQPLSSFNYRTVGIVLEMIPRVTYEDEIVLEMSVENSTRGQDVNIGGSNLPTFSARRVNAKLRLRDGEPNLLAGLIRESDRRSLFRCIVRHWLCQTSIWLGDAHFTICDAFSGSETPITTIARSDRRSIVP
jgi:type II secretory pathway component GspD/PulD (secretin)